jgi:tetratricopeptide (TPR) repeat protein
MKNLKLFVIGLLVLLISINVYSVIFHPSPILNYQLQMSSISTGDRYYGRLSLWYYYAQKGDWTNAHLLESQLDPVDLAGYKDAHDPIALKKYINNLEVKPNKTAEDWLELAQVQYLLGKTGEAVNSVGRAFALDPIRDDISRIYYQIGR